MIGAGGGNAPGDLSFTCEQCRYTELYRGDQSMLGDIFDFFTQ